MTHFSALLKIATALLISCINAQQQQQQIRFQSSAANSDGKVVAPSKPAMDSPFPYEYQICGEDVNLFKLDSLTVASSSFEPMAESARDGMHAVSQSVWYMRLINRLSIASSAVITRPPIRIEVAGRLLEDLLPGTTLELIVKYGMLRLLRLTVDVCDELDNMNDGNGDEDIGKCPISKGAKSLRKTFELPDNIPPGDYTANVLVRSQSGQQIFCAALKFTLSK